MSRTFFTRASEYLADRMQSGAILRDAGNIARAAYGSATEVTARLDDLFQGAMDRLESVVARKLADFSDANQRAAVRLTYATSLRVPVAEQLSLLDAGRYSEQVSTAAAQQRYIPVPVQEFLITNCFRHRDAMIALARNLDADIGGLEPLAGHHHPDVRRTLAEHIGARMRMDEPGIAREKTTVYNAILRHFSSDLAPHVVPVCRDSDQLRDLYAQTSKSPSYLRHFVENPYTPNDVLLDVCACTRLGLQPGGAAVISDAKSRLDKMLSTDHDSTLQPS